MEADMSGRDDIGRRSPAALALTGAVRAYQWTVAPVLGGQCRFEPSCSEYAIAALARHGACHGTALAARRILRCNPWHAGGDDPVPPPRARGFSRTPT
jgi:putative membrane protein insertion efficiency factor